MINIVTFPGLGLEFSLNRVAFHLFGRPIFWYGIIIASGMLLAVYLCSRWAPRFGIVPDHILDMMFFAVPAALVAVRAYYVIFNLDLYRRGDGSLDWGAILRYSDGGLAIYGAIISSVIVLLIFCKVRKVSFLSFADLGVHGLFIGQLIGRWGNFMNVEAFGSTTTLPWRMCGTSIAEYLLQSGYVDQAGYEAVLSGAPGYIPHSSMNPCGTWRDCSWSIRSESGGENTTGSAFCSICAGTVWAAPGSRACGPTACISLGWSCSECPSGCPRWWRWCASWRRARSCCTSAPAPTPRHSCM